jgi:hypothetical protein
MRRKTRCWARGLIVVLLGFGRISAEVRVVGTDLLGLEFTRAVYEWSSGSGVRVALACDGSRKGLAEVLAGRADLGLVMLPPEEAGLIGARRAWPLGFYRVCVLAPSDAGVDAISVAQLAALFGEGEGRAAGARWADLGADGAWGPAPVAAWAPDGSADLTAAYFQHAVLRGRPFKVSVRRYADRADVGIEFAGGSRALALAAGPPTGVGRARVLRVGVGDGTAVAPTIEHLEDGSYPLRLVLHLVPGSRPSAGARAVAAYLTGDQAARLLAAADFVPVPASVRAEQRPLLEAALTPASSSGQDK